MTIASVNAAKAYAAARPTTEPDAGKGQEGLSGLAKDFAATLRNGEETAQAAMTGSVDPHALVQALAQTELAVETAVTVRDKVVKAYQDILRMPV
ncbi:flagellar hook-basal body complex protein FliE [Roseovarius salinarum]|uniref:flagellar hook-basal body complex protein FliE n=1 Tax=Roseovarius salinarum TaxID=1981892 RepID=UPI000C32ECA5|nr:flagellar hook-basal body complex protein FliE [Roseovarius salinarum]